jgi:hypothetical protein
MISRSLHLSLFILFFFFSCTRNPMEVDASDVNIPITYIHLDSVFRVSSQHDLLQKHREYLRDIRGIYEYELGYCLRFANASDSALLNGLRLFMQDVYIQKLEKRLTDKFNDVQKERGEIHSALRYLKYHFPKGKFPTHVVFMNSLFQSGAMSTEKEIGIGLERYLSAEEEVIKKLPGQDFPKWMREDWDEKYIARDAICSWIMTHYVPEKEGNLAEQIIRWGKVIYLTHAAFPEREASFALRYSEKEYSWAVKNEFPFWEYLVKQKLLFETNEKNVVNFLREGPFTGGIPKKGPDRLGQYLGYQIVRKFMETSDVSLAELVNIPYNKILVEYEIE